MPKTPDYYGIRIEDRDELVDYLHDKIHLNPTWDALSYEGRIQSEFHVTLAHRNDASSMRQKWANLAQRLDANAVGDSSGHRKLVFLEEYCDIKLMRAVIFERKLVTVEVKIEKCFLKDARGKFVDEQRIKPLNELLHITIGTASNAIKPFQLNSFLQKLHNAYGDNLGNGDYNVKNGPAEVVRLGKVLRKQQLFILFSNRN